MEPILALTLFWLYYQKRIKLSEMREAIRAAEKDEIFKLVKDGASSKDLLKLGIKSQFITAYYMSAKRASQNS